MRKSLAILVPLILTLAGCSASDGPTLASSGVPGSYRALLLGTTENGVTTDQVAAGADVRVDLATDGSTSGWLHLPASPVGGGTAALDADLAGTWSRSGYVISLHHSADTFLRDMPLTVQDDALVGDATFGTVRVRLTLVKR